MLLTAYDVSYLLLDLGGGSKLMEFQSLKNAIFQIEKMVQSEGEQMQIMLSLQRLSDNLCSFSKKIDEIVQQKKEHQKQNKHLRKKLRKMATKVQKKEEAHRKLQEDLINLKETYAYKLGQMLKKEGKTVHQSRVHILQRQQIKELKSKRQKQIQCEIRSESFVKELQERNLYLLRRLKKLQQNLQDEKNQNNSKQLYIDSLLIALDRQIQMNIELEEKDQQKTTQVTASLCSDPNDISTIDADSLKGQDRSLQIPQGEKKFWLEYEVQGRDVKKSWYNPILNILKKAGMLIWHV